MRRLMKKKKKIRCRRRATKGMKGKKRVKRSNLRRATKAHKKSSLNLSL